MSYWNCVSDVPVSTDQPAYDGVILNQVSALGGAVQRLRAVLDEHYKRLTPVLANIGDQELKGTPRPAYSIPLAEMLVSLVEDIERQTNGLADVTRRVAL